MGQFITWFSVIKDTYWGAVTNYDWWIFVKAEKKDDQVTFTYSDHLPWASETTTTRDFLDNTEQKATWTDLKESALPYLLGLITSVVPK